MWELIEQNRRKSKIVFFAMFLVLESLSIMIGMSIYYPDGGYWGALAGFLIWVVQSMIAYYFGDSIVLSVSRATKVSKESYPVLFNVVEEMQIASSQKHLPEVYVVNDEAMNAFATGIRPEKSAICVTAGLLESLNRDELQGVIAHEMSHIINRDVMFMTFAGVMLGSINMIAKGFVYSTMSGSHSRRSRLGSRSSGGGHPAIIIATIILAIIAPLLAQIFYFAISRKREYLADATAVRLTRYPEGLASALEKISGSAGNLVFYNRITAPMFIINPMALTDGESLLDTSTHPPTHKRIAILRQLQNGGKVSFRDYQTVFSKENGRNKLLPDSALADKGEVAVRSALHTDSEPVTASSKARKITDMIMATSGFLFIPCTCGLKMKVPPTIGKSQIECPRCGRFLTIPSVTSGISHTGEKTKPVEGVNSTYKRQSPDSWESCLCSCGHSIQLSPLFRGRQVICTKCKAKIQIDYPE